MNSEINEETIVYFVMLKSKMTCQRIDLICVAFCMQLGIHCEKIEDPAKLCDRQSMALKVIKKISTRLRFLYRTDEYLNLKVSAHIDLNEIGKNNSLHINDHFEQCICATTFKLFNNSSSAYMNDVFQLISFLNQPLQKTNHRQKALSHLVANI